jgi:hypothetical protein
MTVENENYKNLHNGNDVATSFPFTFRVFEDSDLLVTKAGLDGVETVLVLDTDYTVTGAGDPNGGSITYPVSGDPLAAGEIIAISRNMSFTQLTDLVYGGAWLPSVVENALDRLAMGLLQLKERADNQVRFAITEDREGAEQVNELPTPAPGQIIAWDEEGNLTNTTLAIPPAVNAPTPDNLISAKNIDVTANALIYLAGKTTPRDGFQGWFTYSSGNTETPDDENVFEPNAGGGRWLKDINGKNRTYHVVAGGTESEITIATNPIEGFVLDNTHTFVVENTAGPNAGTVTVTINSLTTLDLKLDNAFNVAAGDSGEIGSKMIITLADDLSEAILTNPARSGGGGGSTFEFDTEWTTVDEICPDTAVLGSGSGAIASLGPDSSGDAVTPKLAFCDATNELLRMYTYRSRPGTAFSGWIQPLGSTLLISPCGVPALCRLDENTVAFIDTNNRELRTYRFDGVGWNLIGAGLSIASAGAGGMALALLQVSGDDYEVVYSDNLDDALRVFVWDNAGEAWSQRGVDSSLGVVSVLSIVSLSDTDIVVAESNGDKICRYRLDRDQLDLNNPAWTLVGNPLVVTLGIGQSSLAALNSSDVVLANTTGPSIRLWRFVTDDINNPSLGDWVEAAPFSLLSGMGAHFTMTALNGTDVAIHDATSGAIRWLRYSYYFKPGPYQITVEP